jgi:hypothetical protein
LREHEHNANGLRIVRVYHTDSNDRLWNGTFGSAPHELGEPGYSLSNGERITL